VLNEADFVGWCRRLALTDTTQASVAEVRTRNPARRVGGGRENVSGRYPSRKMGLTIQFESHRVELPFVNDMEHGPGIMGAAGYFRFLKKRSFFSASVYLRPASVMSF